MEIKEEQHQLQYERLTDQLEQACATHILRSGKIVDNKVGMDTNLPYEYVQVQEDQGEHHEEWNKDDKQEELQRKKSRQGKRKRGEHPE